MTLDFSFLKDIMALRIDLPCDHGMILDQNDPLADLWSKFSYADPGIPHLKTHWVNFVPTAEKLAEYWFNEMQEDIHLRSKQLAILKSVTVEETPNCHATYTPK